MAEPLLRTRTTPPFCEQKRRGRKKRERESRREEQRQRGENKEEEENVRVFLLVCWLVKKKKKVGKKYIAQQVTHFTRILGQGTASKDGRSTVCNICHPTVL